MLVISMHRELISRERLPKDVQGVSSVTLCRGIGNWALAVSKDTLVCLFFFFFLSLPLPLALRKMY